MRRGSSRPSESSAKPCNSNKPTSPESTDDLAAASPRLFRRRRDGDHDQGDVNFLVDVAFVVEDEDRAAGDVGRLALVKWMRAERLPRLPLNLADVLLADEQNERALRIPPDQVPEELIDRRAEVLLACPDLAFADEDRRVLVPDGDVSLSAPTEQLAAAGPELVVEHNQQDLPQDRLEHLAEGARKSLGCQAHAPDDGADVGEGLGRDGRLGHERLRPRTAP